MARRGIPGVIALLLCGFLRAQVQTTADEAVVDETTIAPPAMPDAPAETKPEDFVYVAPTRPDRIGRIMAPVSINGVGPFAFVVDTGASSSVIAPAVARRLGLEPDPGRAKLLRGITGSEVVSTVAVNVITAGAIELQHRDLPVVEPRVFADADGIFGADAFARGCLHVNFTQAEIGILDTACPRVDAWWETLRARVQFGGLVVVRALVGSTRVAAIIDTGAERSLGNSALLKALELEARADDPSARTQVFAATSQAVYGNLVATPPIRLGSMQIGNFSMVFGDFEVFRLWNVHDEPAIVLGMDVLGTTQALMIDFRRAELKLLLPGDPNNVRLRKFGTPSRLPGN